ncbi:MAG TPA: carboxylesterase family protein, partial [Polyangiales bacterium]
DAFGGDPENVTLFGESAGAMSIGCLLAAPAAHGLFRRAIAQSGAAHHVLSADYARRVAAKFVDALGGVDRLWTASGEEIVIAQRSCASELVAKGPPGRQLPQSEVNLLPVVDSDFLPEHPLLAIANGSAADIDLIVGTNRDEWNYFLFLTEPRKRQIDEIALRKILEHRLPGHGVRAIALYRDLLGPDAEAWQLYSAIETDRVFRVPALRLAEAQASVNPNTFVYQFDYGSPLFDRAMGACHALEIPFVFGQMATLFGRTFAGDEPAGAHLSELMSNAWANFARNGDPNPGLEPEWPRYEPTRRSTLHFDANIRVEDDPFAPLRSFWEALH